MTRILFAAVLYLAVGVYLATAFQRDWRWSYEHDEDDHPPPRMISLVPIMVLWLLLVIAALTVAAYRTVRSNT